MPCRASVAVSCARVTPESRTGASTSSSGARTRSAGVETELVVAGRRRAVDDGARADRARVGGDHLGLDRPLRRDRERVDASPQDVAEEKRQGVALPDPARGRPGRRAGARPPRGRARRSCAARPPRSRPCPRSRRGRPPPARAGGRRSRWCPVRRKRRRRRPEVDGSWRGFLRDSTGWRGRKTPRRRT